MSYSNQSTTTKSATESYEIVLKIVPTQGFKIVRTRDFASLVQASKEIDGITITFNVSCVMGKETKVHVACLTSGDSASDAEKAAVDGLLEALNQALAA
jgi:hypothetical protein